MNGSTRARSGVDACSRREVAGAPSPARWVVVALLAALCVGVGRWAQAPVALVVAVTLLAVLGASAAAIDMSSHRLPDQLTALLAVAMVAASIADSIAAASLQPVVQTVAGMVIVFVVMAALVVAGSGIGGGDLKFSAAASGAPALVLGVGGAGLGLAAGLLLVGVTALVARHRGHDAVVFGPGLFAGALTVALIGLAGS